MKVLKTLPERLAANDKRDLSVPQIRVLVALGKAKGPLTRAKLSDKIGNRTNVVVGRAIGYSDPGKRSAFENSKDGGFRPSLLTLGLVREVALDIDGVSETGVTLSAAGRRILESLTKEQLAEARQPLRD